MARRLKSTDPAFASTERLRILEAIQREPGIHTSALATVSGKSVSAILWHVHIMVRAGVVATRREGRYMRHFLNPASQVVSRAAPR